MTNLTGSIDHPIPTARRDNSLLRRVLFVDAATCAATGALLVLGGGRLEPLLGLPAALLQWSGAILLPFTAFVAYLASRESLSRPGIWAVIALNALWVADSILLLIAGGLAPTALGYAFVIAQAAFVAILAELEYMALSRS